MIGRPGRIGALDKILQHIVDRGDTWIARRIDIATHWRPIPGGLMFEARALTNFRAPPIGQGAVAPARSGYP
jgi:hypothetical protein